MHGSPVLCPTEARKGKYDYYENFGRPCKFVHVKLPTELSGVEDLIRSDLGDLQWNEGDQCYHCSGELEIANLQGFIANLGAEVERVTHQLNEEAGSGF